MTGVVVAVEDLATEDVEDSEVEAGKIKNLSSVQNFRYFRNVIASI